MGGQISEIGFLVARKPNEARRAIVELLKEHGGEATKAAAAAGVTRRQFDRWLTRFGLLERAARIRAKVGEAKEVKP